MALAECTLDQRVEMILAAQSERWRRGEPLRTEEDLAHDPELRDNTEAALSVIYHEFCLRDSGEKVPRREEYLERFPWLAARLLELFEVHCGLMSISPKELALGGFQAPPVGEEAQPWPVITGYEILEELGRGGMGIVYKAFQVRLNRIVALKMIRGDSQDRVEINRFRTEALAVARLHHPNVLQIHEIGEQDGRPYLVLEFAEGGSLESQILGIPQAIQRSAELVEMLARGVHAMHLCGVVHRDLKPANVLLAAGKVPKIADFGLAKRTDVEDGQTITGSILGTPGYMAPEQTTGHSGAIGPATDVYALGAILYELLTGRPPHRAGTPLETILAVRSTEPVPPSRLRPKLSRDLETICLKCLEREPTGRYARAEDLADDLHRFLIGEPVQARPVGQATRLWRWCRRNRALASTGALVLMCLVAVVFLSVAISILQSRTTRRVLREQDKTLQALKDASAQRDTAERERLKAQRLAADLAHKRGLDLAEAGDSSRGLLWMARALSMTPKFDGPAQFAIRSSLSLMLRDICPLRWSLTTPNAVLAISFSRDHRYLTAFFRDGTLWKLSTADGSILRTAKVAETGLLSAMIGRDGKTLLTVGQDRKARLWNAENGSPLGKALWHSSPISAAALDPEGRLAATVGDDRAIRLWSVPDGSPFGKTMIHEARVLALAFNLDGSLVVTGDNDGIAKVWKTADGSPVGNSMIHTAGVRAVSFSPDGQAVLTGCEDNAAHLWRVINGAQSDLKLAHQSTVVAVSFSPDGKRVLTGSEDNTARLWNAFDGDLIGGHMSHQGSVLAIAFHPDGRAIATGGDDPGLRFWGITDGDLPGPPLAHAATVLAVAFRPGPGSPVAIACEDNSLTFWHHTQRSSVGADANPPRAVGIAEFSNDGQSLATYGEDTMIRVRRTADGSPLGKPIAHPSAILALAVSADGERLATAGPDCVVRVWNVADGMLVGRPMLHETTVYSLAFSPDGKFLATGDSYFASRVWKISDGSPHGVAMSHRGTVTAIAFSPDGKFLASGGDDNAARIWRIVDGSPISRPMHHEGPVTSLTFSADGRFVLTASKDKTARFWSAADGSPIGNPMRHSDTVLAVAFSHDNRLALTGGNDHFARTWSVPVPTTGESERLLLWTQFITGFSLDEDGVAVAVGNPELQELRRRLDALGWSWTP